ncbi:MAG: helix-turn-helix domain-containing protein [Leptolyngbyaceae cyanobacterium SL_7_1]|nr:helix-turn-helix domain-containing protein [Leptolyngbyaceae cyanobacterium SL_7_1]
MSQFPDGNYTDRLRSLMQSAGLSTYRELAQRAMVSDWQIKQLRQGRAAQLRAESVYRLSQALKLPIAQLLAQFSDLATTNPMDPALPDTEGVSQDLERLTQEYQRLQAQLAHQRETLWQEFQQTSLQALESWLIQFPTAAHAAQANPSVPAVRLLPLMRPVEQLLKEWQVESIAPVGAELPYDPQLHQLMEGSAQPGDRVRVRYAGYRQGDRLLYRAKVSPVLAPTSPEAQ